MSERAVQSDEQVVLVNEHDDVLGAMEKLQAHREGLMHRAFSIFIFDASRRLLVQRRAEGKYHSAGLWTNSCCGHPRPDEPVEQAARRRLTEELGIACDLSPEFIFRYKADVGNGLVEHELDHVFFGTCDGPLSPDPDEVSDVRWMRMSDLADDLGTSAGHYTAWLALCWPQVWERYMRRHST